MAEISKTMESISNLGHNKYVIVNRSFKNFCLTYRSMKKIYKRKGIDLYAYKPVSNTNKKDTFVLVESIIEEDEKKDSKLVYSKKLFKDGFTFTYEFCRNNNLIYPNIIYDNDREDEDYIYIVQKENNHGCVSGLDGLRTIPIPSETQYYIAPKIVNGEESNYEEIHEKHKIW